MAGRRTRGNYAIGSNQRSEASLCSAELSSRTEQTFGQIIQDHI
jgi:hypothetical protein